MVRLRAQFALKFRLTEQGVAYIKTTARELQEYDLDVFAASRGWSMLWAELVVLTFGSILPKILKTAVLAEIRSSKYNINEIAVKYGGGGHKLASGATLKTFTEADLMLADLDNIIKEANNG